MMLVIALFCIISSIVLFIYKSKKKHGPYKSYKGPKKLPILGNALSFKSFTDVLPVFKQFLDENGPICTVTIGPLKRYLLIIDYKLIEHILSSQSLIKKSVDYKFFLKWLGVGLLLSTGEKWKKRRRMITPAFHFKILEESLHIFEKATNVLIEKLHKKVGCDSFDVYPDVTLYALDVICESAMGVSINAQENESSDYVKSVKFMGQLIINRAVSIFKQFDFTFSFFNEYNEEKRALKILHSHTNKVISERREKMKTITSNKKEIDDVAFGYKRNKVAFLDLLLQATIDGKPLSNEDIREEVDTFMFEGHDTTASAISFALYMLSKYPEVQERAYEEQIQIFGNDSNSSPNMAMLQQMKYLDNVIKETLRLYPSVPIISREIEESFEFDGHFIEKGWIAGIDIFHAHRNPEYFPNPEEFNPDRFLDDDGLRPFAFIPFSAGPRNCIG